MADAQTMKLEIRVGADGLVEGLKVATKAVDASAQQMRLAFRGAGDSAKVASDSTSGFVETLKAYKQEQVGASKVAGFYAAEITGMIPGFQGATSALRGLIAATLEGSMIGAGFEVAKVAIEGLASKMEEAKKRMADLRQMSFETGRSISEAMRGVADQFATVKLGGAATAKRDSDRGIDRQIEEKNRKINDLADNIDIIDVIKDSYGMSGGPHAQIEKLRAEIKELQARKASPTANLEFEHAQGTEQTFNAQEGAQRLKEIEASTASEIVRIRAERDRKLLDLSRVSDDDPTKKTQIEAVKLAAERQAGDVKIAWRREHEQQMVALSKSTQNAVEQIEAEHTERVKEIRERFRKRLISDDASERQQARSAMKAELAAEEGARLESLFKQRVAHAQFRLAQQRDDAERMATLVKGEQEGEAIRERLQHEFLGHEAASQILSIKQREQAEKDALLSLRNAHHVSAEVFSAEMARIVADSKRSQALVRGQWAQPFVDPLVQNWQTGLDQMLSGTYRWGSLFQNIFGSVLQAFKQGVLQMGANWLKNELIMTAGTEAGVIERIAITSWGVIKSVALAAWEGLQWIGIQAWKAAAGAYAAIAEIPIIGPVLAPVTAAAAAAAVLGLGYHIATAAGGYDIPGGTNPITQLHEKEMVLPKHIAEPLRQSLQGGGLGAITVNLHTLDATGFDRVLRNNEGALVRAIREATRNGRLK